MKIEALEFFLDGRECFEKDDIRTVSDEDGQYFCDNGWAKDVTGAVKTGKRKTDGAVVLDVRGSHHASTASEV